jgi:hypothetical protein
MQPCSAQCVERLRRGTALALADDAASMCPAESSCNTKTLAVTIFTTRQLRIGHPSIDRELFSGTTLMMT